MVPTEETEMTVSATLGGQPGSAFRAPTILQQKKGKRWSNEEDGLLRNAIQVCGERRWRDIAELVPSRSAVQCLHRWTKILRPGLVKGPWSLEEDEALRSWVSSHGASEWAKCAQVIQGRNGKQCRERWNNTLDPSLHHGHWTPAEDSLIFDRYYKEGPKWSLIAKEIPGRSENTIKNRFYSNVRKMLKNKKKGGSGSEHDSRSAYTSDFPCDYDDHIRRKTIATITGFFMQFSPIDLVSALSEENHRGTAQEIGLVVPVPRYGRIQ